jgi:hypothetical protein
VDWLYKKLLTGAIRKGLVALTVWLVTRGVLDQSDQAPALAKVADYAPILAAFIWDWVEKYQDAQHRQVALDASGMSAKQVSVEAKGVKLK